MNKTLKTTKNHKNQEKKISSNLPLEERLKVIANLIVDRIIEDQINGTLHLKIQGVKQP